MPDAMSAELRAAAQVALEDLSSATSFLSKKSRDRAPKTIERLRAAIAIAPPAPPVGGLTDEQKPGLQRLERWARLLKEEGNSLGDVLLGYCEEWRADLGDASGPGSSLQPPSSASAAIPIAKTYDQWHPYTERSKG